MHKPIVLIGMMGCGKTTIGSKLAEKLGWLFKDSDIVLVKETGKSVEKWFQEEGEAAFRQVEKETIKRLLQNNKAMVLSLGGGAFLQPETREMVLQQAVVIWLDAPAKELWQRVKHQNIVRPLLQQSDKKPEQILIDLLEERTPVYQQAPIHFQTQGLSVGKTVQQLYKIIMEL